MARAGPAESGRMSPVPVPTAPPAQSDLGVPAGPAPLPNDHFSGQQGVTALRGQSLPGDRPPCAARALPCGAIPLGQGDGTARRWRPVSPPCWATPLVPSAASGQTGLACHRSTCASLDVSLPLPYQRDRGDQAVVGHQVSPTCQWWHSGPCVPVSRGQPVPCRAWSGVPGLHPNAGGNPCHDNPNASSSARSPRGRCRPCLTHFPEGPRRAWGDPGWCGLTPPLASGRQGGRDSSRGPKAALGGRWRREDRVQHLDGTFLQRFPGQRQGGSRA